MDLIRGEEDLVRGEDNTVDPGALLVVEEGGRVCAVRVTNLNIHKLINILSIWVICM